jgi:hypothetical protein
MSSAAIHDPSAAGTAILPPRPPMPASGNRLFRLIQAGNIAALLLTVCLLLATWCLFLGSRGYIDYVEGLVLFHQTQAAAGENIYDAKFRAAPLYSLPMYGPVFYYLVAPAVAIYPSLLPGRVVSILCLLAMSGLSWRLLRRQFGVSRLTAAMGAIPWLILLGPLYFGENNRVDSLSIFFGVAALFAANSPRPKVWWACIPLLLLAGFTRSTAAIAPGAAIFLVFLLSHRVKQASILASTVVVSAIAIVLLGDWFSSGNFSKCLIFSNGSVPLQKAYLTIITVQVCKQALLPAGVIAALFLVRDPATRLFGLHTLLSFALAVVTSAKIGSHVNYFIEPSWSAGLSLGLVLSKLHRPQWLRLAAAAMCVLLVQSAGRAYGRVKQFGVEMEQFPGVMSLVEKYGARGPLLTMESGAQVFAGQPIYVADMHIFTRLNEAGKFDLAPILDDLRQHRLSAIIAGEDIRPDFVGHSNWTREMRTVVALHYRTMEEYAGRTVYVPREKPLVEEEAAAQHTQRSVVQTTFYPNHQKATEVPLVEGRKRPVIELKDHTIHWQKEGVEREWNEYGRLLRETTFVEGNQDGPDVRWYENGQLASRATYAKGCRHGIATTWYPNGRKWTEARYEVGVLRGETARWDEQGRSIDRFSAEQLTQKTGSSQLR